MHTLGREIRFSINPFSSAQQQGFNSYASKPIGSEGLCLFLSLKVELSSSLNPDTGFVVNVARIDASVRNVVVPLISDTITTLCRNCQVPTLQNLANMLQTCWGPLQEEFPGKQLQCLILNLNPYRSISIQSEDCMEMYYSEKFEFSAMHQLWNNKFDDTQNYEMFGKCANPAGHGHNYILEVKVTRPINLEDEHWIIEYQNVVKEIFVDIVDHKNLNMDVAGFENLNPTVENLARFAWESLADKFNRCKLCSITIWENDRTYCTYSE